jgi:hypothetical protein
MKFSNYPKWAKVAMISSVVLIILRVVQKIFAIRTPADNATNIAMNVAVGASLVAIIMGLLDKNRSEK